MRGLQVCFPLDAPSCAYVRGHGAFELLREIRGRSPVYGIRARAWAVQPQTARDVIAVAESRGWRVEVITEEHLLRLAGVETDEKRARHAEAKGQLW